MRRASKASVAVDVVSAIIVLLMIHAYVSGSTTKLNPFAQHVEITFVKYTNSPGYSHAVFRMKNNSLLPIRYEGYGKTPQLTYQRWKGDAWEDTVWDWCGTGLGTQYMWPGQSVTFEASADPGVPTRVGTGICLGPISRYILVWSSPTEPIH